MIDPSAIVEEQLLKELGSALARGAVKIISTSGRALATYFVQLQQTQNRSLEDTTYPPMIVVGLGRCGSFVTGQLVSMLGKTEARTEGPVVGSSSPTAAPDSQTKVGPSTQNRYAAFIRNLGGFFGSGNGQGPVFAVEPKMFMGDIDETIFSDVVGSLSKSDGPLTSKLLQISYEPLAYGGVGNTPIFSEFLTRGLLLLPPAKLDDRDNPWLLARTLLLDGYSIHGQKLRLAFYIFAASGGTGSGAASEFLRAQRFSLAVSGVPHQVFFCGIAVLPRENLLRNNQTHQRNAGRLLTQYLSELNIALPDAMSFETAPEFQYDVRVQIDATPSQSALNGKAADASPKQADQVVVTTNFGIPLVPWDALLFVSNDVMPTNPSADTAGFEQADAEANKYIAQCMFNLSSAQLPIAQISDKKIEKQTPETKNFQSRRLDPNDLRTGLTGPVCVGYSAMSIADTRADDKWVDRLFAGSLALPNRRGNEKLEMESPVQGISVSPEPKAAYADKILELSNAIQAGNPKAFEDALNVVAQIPLFQRCPRAVLIFTSPQTGDIPAAIEDRLDLLTNLLCPNLVQLRTAIIRGTTTLYTMTVLFEASVVNAPDILSSFVNYLWYSFAKPSVTAEQFDETLKELLNRHDGNAITDTDLEPILIDKEDWPRTVPNCNYLISNWERNWTIFKEKQREVKSELVSRSADQHKMENFVVIREQVVRAVNYIRYARHFGKRPPRPISTFL